MSPLRGPANEKPRQQPSTRRIAAILAIPAFRGKIIRRPPSGKIAPPRWQLHREAVQMAGTRVAPGRARYFTQLGQEAVYVSITRSWGIPPGSSHPVV
jgi:hypothetical protein